MTEDVTHLTVDYSVLQDRLLISMRTRGRGKYRFWVTRRTAKSICRGVVNALEKSLGANALTEAARAAMLAMQHDDAVKSRDFSVGRKKTKSKEIAAPLVAGVRCGARKDGVRMTLGTDDDRQLALFLTPEQVHVMLHLIDSVTDEAGWLLDIPLGHDPGMDERPEVVH
jgi:hypothetical protein